jgi:Fe-S cluster assembly protein SufD
MEITFNTEGFTSGPNAQEPAWLQNLRKEAKTNFDDLGLPTPKLEDWRYTNLKEFAKNNFISALKDTPVEINKLISGCKLPEMDGYTVVTLNGAFLEKESDLKGLPDGVTILPLSEALLDDNLAAAKLFNSNLDISSYAFQALNTANFQDGIFFHVAKGVKLDKPLIIYSLTTAAKNPVISFPRNLFVFEEEAQATFLEMYNGEGIYAAAPVNETIVRKSAEVYRYSVNRTNDQSYFFGSAATLQESDSNYTSLNVILGGALYRNDMFVDLNGDDIESSINGLYHQTGSRQTDNFTRVRHLGLRGESTQVFKGVLDDTSKGVFDGRIYVQEGAQQTDAVQTNRNLLLSDDAVSYAKPQLEIYADDVKCTHGATTGQLDETMLFYLLSRGYDPKAAKAELIYAFAAELVDEITVEPLKEQLREELYTLLSLRA